MFQINYVLKASNLPEEVGEKQLTYQETHKMLTEMEVHREQTPDDSTGGCEKWALAKLDAISPCCLVMPDTAKLRARFT